MHNIVDNIKIEQVLKPQTVSTAAVVSDSVDVLGAENLAVAVMVGTFADTLSSTAKVDLKIEHSDDDTSYAACVDSDVANFSGLVSGVFASIDAEGKESSRYVIEYIGSKRYVRVTATPTGLTTGGAIAMAALTANHAQKPVSNS